MKRTLGFLFCLLVLMTGNIFAQERILGRPVFELPFFSDIDENGFMRQQSRVVYGKFFADELVISVKEPAGDSYSVLRAGVNTLIQAMTAGVVSEVLNPVSQKPDGYGFTNDDLQLQRETGFDRYYTLKLNTATKNELLDWYQKFSNDTKIRSVSLSPVFQTASHSYNDPLLPTQWNFSKISGFAAHHTTFGSNQVYVFVLDTGVFLGHEDLKGASIFFDYDAISDQPGNGNTDDFGHGTHVFTTICAQANNSKGIVGLAPSINCGNIKVLSGGFGTINTVSNGILVAASKAREIKVANPGAQFVLNMSLGAFGRFPVLDSAVEVARKAGILIVAAAGNNQTNIDEAPFSPASSPGAVAVVATDNQDGRAFFSNYGVKTFTVAAPGDRILAGVPSGGVFFSSPSGYMSLSGTSMASPHVAAYAALMMSKRQFNEEKIKFALLFNNDDIAQLTRFVKSAGRINLALGLNLPQVPPVTPTDLHSPAPWWQRHSSIRLAWTSTCDESCGKLAGAIIYYSDKVFDSASLNSKQVKRNELIPLRKGWGEEVNHLLPDLKGNTQYFAALQVLDRGGNISALSDIVSLNTKEAEMLQIDTFESDGLANPGNWLVVEGPADASIKDFYDKNPFLWHLSANASVSTPFAWRYGVENKFNYNTGQATDSMLVSPIFDASFYAGLSLRFQRFQQIVGDDTVQIYIKELDSSNRGVWLLVKQFSADENNQTLSFDEFRHDLTQFEGKKFQIAIRFLALSSGQTIGFIMDNFEVMVDK